MTNFATMILFIFTILSKPQKFGQYLMARIYKLENASCNTENLTKSGKEFLDEKLKISKKL